MKKVRKILSVTFLAFAIGVTILPTQNAHAAKVATVVDYEDVKVTDEGCRIPVNTVYEDITFINGYRLSDTNITKISAWYETPVWRYDYIYSTY